MVPLTSTASLLNLIWLDYHLVLQEDGMALPTPLTFDLLNTYVHLEAGGNAVPEEVGDDFWTKIAPTPMRECDSCAPST
jgi:hypothetical protein